MLMRGRRSRIPCGGFVFRIDAVDASPGAQLNVEKRFLDALKKVKLDAALFFPREIASFQRAAQVSWQRAAAQRQFGSSVKVIIAP